MPGPGEPRWTAEDRDKALAFTMTQAESCPQCGTREEDWLDHKGLPHDPPLLEPVIKRCPGCAERARLREAFEEEMSSSYGKGEAAAGQLRRAMAGHFIVLSPFDPYRDDVMPNGGD